MTTSQQADQLRLLGGFPNAEPPVAVLSRAVINVNGDVIWSADDPTTLNFTIVSSATLVSPVISTGLTASGSAANDFSASTGTFKTSSGAGTLSGTTTLAANKNLLCAAGTSLFDFSLGTGIFKTPTGLGTLGGKTAFKVVATPVAATGTAGGVAGAAALGSANIVAVSSDGATKGVKLLTGVAGDIVHVLNTSSTACNLFAASGGTINGGSADAGCAIPASKGVKAICTAADTWTVFDLAAHSGAAA